MNSDSRNQRRDFHGRSAARASFLAIAAVALISFLIRLTGPSNLLDNDQLRPAAYAMDIVLNGHWWCQTDFGGDVASKPPFYTWLVALLSLPAGHVSLAALYIPCAAALGLLAICVFYFTRNALGHRAATISALILLASPLASKHMALARTDAVFAAAVGITSLLVFRAWSSAGRWTASWFAAAIATLTKGPLGIPIAAAGLLASLWEKKSGTPSPVRGNHIPGLLLFALLIGGWFAMAYSECGQSLIAKQLGDELIGHAVSDSKGRLPGSGFYKPPAYFFAQFFPWSMFTLLAVWRVIVSPDHRDHRRQLERFAACWFGAGLFIFMLAPHQRADHLLPILAPAAILAGSQLAIIMESKSARALVRIWTTIIVAFLALELMWYHGFSRNQDSVVRTRAVDSFLQELTNANPDARILITDAPSAVFYFLNTKAPRSTTDAAASALCHDPSTLIFARDPGELLAAAAKLGCAPTVIARWPADGEPFISAIKAQPAISTFKPTLESPLPQSGKVSSSAASHVSQSVPTQTRTQLNDDSFTR